MKKCHFCNALAEYEFTYADLRLCACNPHFDLVKLATCSIREVENAITGKAVKMKVQRGQVDYGAKRMVAA